MTKTSATIVCLLLALCLFPLRATASDEDIWMESARRDAERDGYKVISARDLANVIAHNPDALIVDARADYEFEAGHIPNAVNFEFDLGDRSNLTPEKRAAYEKLLGPDKKRLLVIYCRSFR
jgi:rhodanese-related sulfurtransferase